MIHDPHSQAAVQFICQVLLLLLRVKLMNKYPAPFDRACA